MFKSTVLAHFNNNGAAVARAIGITRSAVHQWDDKDEKPIPEAMAYRLERVTDGALKVDPSVYSKSSDSTEAAA